MMGMMNEDALKMIAEGARMLAGEQIKSGMRKGVNRDGSEFTMTITLPAEVDAGENEPPIKKKLKEYGIEAE